MSTFTVPEFIPATSGIYKFSTTTDTEHDGPSMGWLITNQKLATRFTQSKSSTTLKASVTY
ncbi:hypothetical protein UA08_06700 [Talaromyces atroroseus]|uniref:Uncharacterized protein n=1 Tax=Talaromyces atroroseus TaxID=1441469 RepID=A0A225AG24_TALAT|nr:hypothetical protein UA08_06700 [Talaromyces atroroseus]OKL58113.1 hypothetical protein UA08_06700 [Talaromyces atroroseus]